MTANNRVVDVDVVVEKKRRNFSYFDGFGFVMMCVCARFGNKQKS